MTTTVDEKSTKELTWKGLIKEALRVRDESNLAGHTSALRAAISPASETFAFAYTEKYLSRLKPVQRAAARRAAAICASSKGAKQPDKQADGKPTFKPIGRSIGDLKNRSGGAGDSIASQINSLPLLDMESAATVLGLLIQRCAAKGITVDYFDLARTLINWGNGINEKSRNTRGNVVAAFHQVSNNK